MADQTDYDALAEIYDVWISTVPVCEQNRPFYVEEYLATDGVVVELGVGTGRIALEAAKRGKAVIGVDSSRGMLDRFRQGAKEAGVLDKVTLIQADFRDFILPEPAALIAIPFHSIGHALTPDDKLAVFRHIRTQLAPSGRLILDHFIFDPKIAQSIDRRAMLRAEYKHPESGNDVFLWCCIVYHHDTQQMRAITWTDEVDEHGVVIERKYRSTRNSWTQPEQMRMLLQESGLVIETAYGDFDRTPLADDSPQQIWVAKPAAE